MTTSIWRIRLTVTSMAAVLCSAALLQPANAQITTIQWTGGNDPMFWNQTGNWSPTNIPDTNEELALFDSTGNPAGDKMSIWLSNDRTVQGIRWDDIRFQLSGTGRTLSLDGSQATSGRALVQASDNGNMDGIRVDVELLTDTEFHSPHGGWDHAISGEIRGGGAIYKTGGGRFLFSNSNTFTGVTYVQEGYLRVFSGGLGADGAGQHTVVENGGGLELYPTTFGTTYERLFIEGAGPSGNSALSGVSNANWAGEVTLTGDTAIGYVSLGGNFTISGDIGEQGGSFGIDVANSMNQSLTLSGNNTYTGDTNVLTNATLINNGVIVGTTNVTSPGSLAKGTGVYGLVNVANGGVFAPGTSVGEATTDTAAWQAGGGYEVEIDIATGTAGQDWDLWSISASAGSLLDVEATAGDVFRVLVAGTAAGFDNSLDYSWLIAETAGGIVGFSEDKFAVDTSGFVPSLGGGQFSLSQVDSSLFLNFNADGDGAVPAPSAIVGLAGLALSGLGYWFIRRRR